MTIKVETVNYKTAFWMYKDGKVNIDGKEYSVKLITAPYKYKLTGFLMKFTHGNTLYIVPEYFNRAVNEFIIYKLTGVKNFSKKLEKTKSNKLNKHIKTGGKVVDEKDNVKLIDFNGIVLIVSGNTIYYDKFDKDKLINYYK